MKPTQNEFERKFNKVATILFAILFTLFVGASLGILPSRDPEGLGLLFGASLEIFAVVYIVAMIVIKIVKTVRGFIKK